MNANDKSNFLIKVENASESCIGDIKRITGYIYGKYIVPVIDTLDLEANPRSSKSSAVTEAIQESIAQTPQLFAFKSKGILMAFSNYEALERSRYRFYVDNPMLEGILDGGHNTLAIGLYTLKKAYDYCEIKFPKGIKIWSDFKDIWEKSKEILEKYLEYLKNNHDVKDLDYYIPVEIIVPRDVKDLACVTNFVNSLFEICYARNNNAQLIDSDKANHKGFYDDLKAFVEEKSPDLANRIAWKSNEGGDIKAQDIVALALIPLSLISPIVDENDKPIEPIAPQKLYSAKGISLQHFERIMASPQVTLVDETNSRHILLNEEVISALKIAADLPELYDYIYQNFPDLYNKAGGAYRNIGAIRKLNPEEKNNSKPPKKKYTPFMRTEIDTLSPDGFIMPVVFGLQTLMKKKTINGKTIIAWSQDPMEFLKNNLEKIVKKYMTTVKMGGFDPQKVGKDATSYEYVSDLYDVALITSE